MNYLTLAQFKIALRDFGGAAEVDPVYVMALDAAEATIDKFVGYNVWEECEATVSADIVNAGYTLAMIHVDAMDPARQLAARGAVESVLRDYRREVGIAGGEMAA